MHSHTTILVSFLIFAVILHATTISNAAPSYDPETLNELTQMLLRRRDDMLSTKRGLDLGFDRGYSGKMAAKYLTGLEMAGPLGPGRKRRSGSGSETNFPIYLMDNDKHMAYWNNNDNTKRGLGLDLGFGRGFSGVQAARHLIGLEEANDAMGPGRRRRSISDITA